MSVQKLKIVRIAQTTLTHSNLGPPGGSFEAEPSIMEWMELDPKATDADALAEFAGRGCYESWHKPNPATASNAGYVAHVLDVRHHTLFAHSSVSYRIEGVSRSLTHELVRHRFPTFSQLSQRYVTLDKSLPYVVPPLMRGDADAEELLQQAAQHALDHYEMLIEHLSELHPDAKIKEIREAARCVLPNMTETKLAVTANLRAWRDMFALRLPLTADAEIRELCAGILADLKEYAPNSFADIEMPELGVTGA